ncbi:hypothetical protein CR513_11475, partial [Mucuna pruriens]
MHVGHLLLGRPWQFDRKVTHDGYKNRYTLTMNKRIIVLTPLKPVEAYSDQIRISRECKLKEEQLSIQDKEGKESMSENKQKKEKHEIECNEEKSKKMSAFVKKKEVESALLAKEKVFVLLYKDVYFTNEFHSSFPCEADSLLQEFTNVFPDEVPHGLPPLREGGNDRNSTEKDKDYLHDIGGPMTKSKTKMRKQSLQGLSLGIKESLKQSESEAAPKWIGFQHGACLDSIGSDGKGSRSEWCYDRGLGMEPALKYGDFSLELDGCLDLGLDKWSRPRASLEHGAWMILTRSRLELCHGVDIGDLALGRLRDSTWRLDTELAQDPIRSGQRT